MLCWEKRTRPFETHWRAPLSSRYFLARLINRQPHWLPVLERSEDRSAAHHPRHQKQELRQPVTSAPQVVLKMNIGFLNTS